MKLSYYSETTIAGIHPYSIIIQMRFLDSNPEVCKTQDPFHGQVHDRLFEVRELTANTGAFAAVLEDRGWFEYDICGPTSFDSPIIKGTLRETHGRGSLNFGSGGALGRLRESLGSPYSWVPLIRALQDSLVYSLIYMYIHLLQAQILLRIL